MGKLFFSKKHNFCFEYQQKKSFTSIKKELNFKKRDEINRVQTAKNVSTSDKNINNYMFDQNFQIQKQIASGSNFSTHQTNIPMSNGLTKVKNIDVQLKPPAFGQGNAINNNNKNQYQNPQQNQFQNPLRLQNQLQIQN